MTEAMAPVLANVQKIVDLQRLKWLVDLVGNKKFPKRQS